MFINYKREITDYKRDYNRYLNEIWHRTEIPHYQHAGVAKFT